MLPVFPRWLACVRCRRRRLPLAKDRRDLRGSRSALLSWTSCSQGQELEVEVEASESTLKVTQTVAVMGMTRGWVLEEMAVTEILVYWRRWTAVVVVEERKQTED